MLALKFLAWRVTGSVALYSDALESIVNVGRRGDRLPRDPPRRTSPPTSHHPYGHHKAEYFSAVIEGVLIVIAALARSAGGVAGHPGAACDRAAAPRSRHQRPRRRPQRGVVLVLISTGEAHPSPALVADGKHLFTDVMSTIGATVGVVARRGHRLAHLDPLIGMLVAVNIVWSGTR